MPVVAWDWEDRMVCQLDQHMEDTFAGRVVEGLADNSAFE